MKNLKTGDVTDLPLSGIFFAIGACAPSFELTPQQPVLALNVLAPRINLTVSWLYNQPHPHRPRARHQVPGWPAEAG